MIHPVVAVIQARMGSTRFPHKVLQPIVGEPMILRQLERVSRARTLEKIVVATTENAQDDRLADTVQAAGYSVFRGDEDDVLDRYRMAARAHGAATVVRLTADCPLADPHVIDLVVDAYLERGGEVDFVSNAITGTYPDGLDTEVFGAHVLEKAWEEARLPSEREHVTFYLWKTGRFSVLSLESPEPLGHIRLTVDYPEDLELVREIYERLYPSTPDFTTQDVLSVIAEMPRLVNENVPRNMGWQPALGKDQEFLSEKD